MSAKSKFKPGAFKAPPAPRTKEVINQDYSQVAAQLGDLTIKAESIKRQIQQCVNKVDQLGDEMNRRTELDKQSEPKKEEINGNSQQG